MGFIGLLEYIGFRAYRIYKVKGPPQVPFWSVVVGM